jgi:hypothetical protein
MYGDKAKKVGASAFADMNARLVKTRRRVGSDDWLAVDACDHSL